MRVATERMDVVVDVVVNGDVDGDGSYSSHSQAIM